MITLYELDRVPIWLGKSHFQQQVGWGTKLGANRQRPSVRSSLARLLRRAGRSVSVASSLVNSKKIFPLELAFTLVTFEKCLLLNRFEPAYRFHGFGKGNIRSVLIFQDLLFNCCGHSDLRFWSWNFDILLVRKREWVCYSFVCVWSFHQTMFLFVAPHTVGCFLLFVLIFHQQTILLLVLISQQTIMLLVLIAQITSAALCLQLTQLETLAQF